MTTFQLVEQSKINITHSTVYEVPLEDSMSFHVRSCFTLDCEDIEDKAEEIASSMNLLKLEEDKRSNVIDFTFKPGYKDVEPAKEDKRNNLVPVSIKLTSW